MKKTVSNPCVAAIILFTLSACSNRDNHDHPELKTGAELFNHHCAECHGEDGTGKLLDRKPANILTQKRRQEIINYIRTDVNPERKMPVFAGMPTLEANRIADQLLKLKKTYQNTSPEQKKNRSLLIEP